jgi:hypothetical protein
MSETADSSTIPCDEILFRAILKKKHLADGGVDAGAFILRHQDEGKLSTWRKKLVTYAVCRASYKTCFGLVTLHVGRVRATVDGERSLSLDVIGDELPSDPFPGHASILNLPDPTADPVLAERVASLLRDQSRQGSD